MALLTCEEFDWYVVFISMSISTIAIGENHPSSVVFLHAISVGYICMLVNAQGLQYTADYLQKMIWEFKRFYVLRIVAP